MHALFRRSQKDARTSIRRPSRSQTPVACHSTVWILLHAIGKRIRHPCCNCMRLRQHGGNHCVALQWQTDATMCGDRRCRRRVRRRRGQRAAGRQRRQFRQWRRRPEASPGNPQRPRHPHRGAPIGSRAVGLEQSSRPVSEVRQHTGHIALMAVTYCHFGHSLLSWGCAMPACIDADVLPLHTGPVQGRQQRRHGRRQQAGSRSRQTLM